MLNKFHGAQQIPRSAFVGWFVAIFSLFYFVIFDVEKYRAPARRYIEVEAVVVEGRTRSQVATAAYRIGETTYHVGLLKGTLGDKVLLYASREDLRVATPNKPRPDWNRVAQGIALAVLFGAMAAGYWTYMQFVWMPWRNRNRS